MMLERSCKRKLLDHASGGPSEMYNSMLLELSRQHVRFTVNEFEKAVEIARGILSMAGLRDS